MLQVVTRLSGAKASTMNNVLLLHTTIDPQTWLRTAFSRDEEGTNGNIASHQWTATRSAN